MPIYEYHCGDCSHKFERLQKISDPVPSECPQCGSAQVRRLISAAGFRLKGGGWYETDFKAGDKRNLHESSEKGRKDKADKVETPVKPSSPAPSSSTSAAKPATASE